MNNYNGWKNYETWCVAIAISNNQDFYRLAQRCDSYQDFLNSVWTNFTSKDDDYSISFTDSRIDREAITDLIKEKKRG